MVVYIIVNFKNKTVYIGKTKRINTIRNTIATRVRCGYRSVLIDWIRNLGLENIHIGVLDEDETKMNWWVDKLYMNCIKRYSHKYKERRWIGE